MASPLGGFADLTPYIAAALSQKVNPLDSLFQGVQQGVNVAQLPQEIQNNELNQQLQQAVALAKIKELQSGQLHNVGGNLVRINPTTGQPEVIFKPETPETQQFVGLVNNQPLMVGSRSGKFSISSLPQGVDLTGGIAPKVNTPETFSTIDTGANGLYKTGNRSTTAVPLTTTPGEQLQKPATSAPYRFSDANGFLMQQTSPDKPATQVVDANNEPINIGIANHVVQGEKGAYTVPSKSKGPPVATPLTTNEENGPVQLKKDTGAEDKAKAKLTDQLYKEVQSNKPYQAFVTVSDATEGLRQTLQYAQSNPTDQTGIKSSAVDAFNKIINPKSVVRQQAFSQTTAGQSLINAGDNFIKGLGTGQTITPEQIQTMLDIAEKYQQGATNSVRKELVVLKHRGDKGGIDPEDYLPGLFSGNLNAPTSSAVKPSNASDYLNKFK